MSLLFLLLVCSTGAMDFKGEWRAPCDQTPCTKTCGGGTKDIKYMVCHKEHKDDECDPDGEDAVSDCNQIPCPEIDPVRIVKPGITIDTKLQCAPISTEMIGEYDDRVHFLGKKFSESNLVERGSCNVTLETEMHSILSEISKDMEHLDPNFDSLESYSGDIQMRRWDNLDLIIEKHHFLKSVADKVKRILTLEGCGI